MSTTPVKRKVYASTIGAGAGYTVSEFCLWIVDRIWWPADDVNPPLQVASMVGLVATVGFAFIAGWLAKEGIEIPVVEDDEPVVL